MAPSPPERADSADFDLLIDWDQLQVQVQWADPAPERGHWGSILAFDPTEQRWVDRWRFRTDKADQQRTWAPAGATDCEDELAAGPGPDLVTLLADMRSEPDLLSWNPSPRRTGRTRQSTCWSCT